MIIQNLIDTILTPEIKDLNFIDRYAGVTKVLTTNQLAVNGGVIKKYPISCCVTERDCNDNALYSDLVPNDDKKSVIYWEIIQPMQNRGRTPQLNSSKYLRFNGRARLVVWLNLAKLGWQMGGSQGDEGCNGSVYAVPSLMKILTKQGKVMNGVYENRNIKIEPRGLVTDLNQIFGKYDYPSTLNYHFYPFGYFAIDVDFQLDMCMNNDYQFPVVDPIECIKYSCDTAIPIPTDSLVVDINAEMGVNGGTPTNLDPISLMVDQSGLGNDFIQSDVSDQPTYVDNGINSLPSIAFDGSYLERSMFPVMANSSYSVWVVMQKTGTATGSTILGNVFMLFCNSYNSTSAGFIRFSEGFFTANQYTIDSTFAALKADVADNAIGTPYVFGIVKDGNDIKYYINGVVVFSVTQVVTGTATYASLGSWNNSNFTGLIPRFLVYNKANTTQEIDDINNSLMTKYGI